MRKRLRKKLRLHEFKQLGFDVNFQTPASADSDEFLDRFLLEAVEANDLYCGGGGGPTAWHFFVYAPGRRSASLEQRDALLAWLRQAGASAVRAGEFEDAWWGPEGRPRH